MQKKKHTRKKSPCKEADREANEDKLFRIKRSGAPQRRPQAVAKQLLTGHHAKHGRADREPAQESGFAGSEAPVSVYKKRAQCFQRTLFVIDKTIKTMQTFPCAFQSMHGSKLDGHLLEQKEPEFLHRIRNS